MTVLTTETLSPQTGAVTESRPDPEVPAKAKRRTFTAAFKAKVLEEYEAAPQGSKGQVLRKYGIGSWHISDWRRARAAGAQAGLAAKRGPKPADERDKRIRELEAENAKLADRLRKAEKTIDVQGKASALLQALCESADEDEQGRA
jgi:transposase-like protein